MRKNENAYKPYYGIINTVSKRVDDDVLPKTIEDIYEIAYDLSEFTIDYEDYNECSIILEILS